MTTSAHTLAEALERLATRFLSAESDGTNLVQLHTDDFCNLRDAAARVDEHARLYNEGAEAVTRAVLRTRISTLNFAAKYSRNPLDQQYFTTLAKSWRGVRAARSMRNRGGE